MSVMIYFNVTFRNLLDESATVTFFGIKRTILAGASTIITGGLQEGYSVPVAMILSPSDAEFAEYLAAAVGIGSSQTLTIVRSWLTSPEQPPPVAPVQTSMWPLLVLLVFGAYLFLGRKR